MIQPHATDPHALLSSAACVLFDFDGPMCRLFAGHSAEGVAQRLSGRLAAFDDDPVSVSVAASVRDADPIGVLLAVRKHRPDDRVLMAVLDEQLTEEEVVAAGRATPTPGAAELVRALAGAGTRLAVTTNNSPAAVTSYLAREGLGPLFDGHIHGRSPDPALLKPDPDCLYRALRTTGVDAGDALMIGDSPADWLAANKAGIPFLGYAENARKYRELRDAGAEVSVSTLEGLARAAGSPRERNTSVARTAAASVRCEITRPETTE
ncbi:HAD family hydrolase [Streptomyces sp. NPDC059499]|uniref:HAD family hydrolase n=1 Tax=Streptomyces sp. NPDC059499 TaxID=3346852 RepID=UPI0036B36C3F